MKRTAEFITRVAIATALGAGIGACGRGDPGAASPPTASSPAAAPPTERVAAADPAQTAPLEAAQVTAPTQASATAAGDTARYAAVISVQPFKQTVDHPREDCRDERVVHRRKPKDQHQIAGTVIGAIAGGVIGNQVGGGRGRDLTTVAGAVGGGFAGRKIQEGQQNRRTYTTIERRCRTINESSEDVVAYDVVYEYLGSTHQVRLDHDPGDRIELPVRGID